ncbi:unnamed protein product [Amoebophrya sp. A25]|nr:unnamed protein product [Amoebophrya sp. A25]|eukprot:GSA25T00002598001.1
MLHNKLRTHGNNRRQVEQARQQHAEMKARKKQEQEQQLATPVPLNQVAPNESFNKGLMLNPSTSLENSFQQQQQELTNSGRREVFTSPHVTPGEVLTSPQVTPAPRPPPSVAHLEPLRKHVSSGRIAHYARQLGFYHTPSQHMHPSQMSRDDMTWPNDMDSSLFQQSEANRQGLPVVQSPDAAQHSLGGSPHSARQEESEFLLANKYHEANMVRNLAHPHHDTDASSALPFMAPQQQLPYPYEHPYYPQHLQHYQQQQVAPHNQQQQLQMHGMQHAASVSMPLPGMQHSQMPTSQMVQEPPGPIMSDFHAVSLGREDAPSPPKEDALPDDRVDQVDCSASPCGGEMNDAESPVTISTMPTEDLRTRKTRINSTLRSPVTISTVPGGEDLHTRKTRINSTIRLENHDNAFYNMPPCYSSRDHREVVVSSDCSQGYKYEYPELHLQDVIGLVPSQALGRGVSDARGWSGATPYNPLHQESGLEKASGAAPSTSSMQQSGKDFNASRQASRNAAAFGGIRTILQPSSDDDESSLWSVFLRLSQHQHLGTTLFR